MNEHLPEHRAAQLSAEMRRDLEDAEVATISEVSTPPVWNTPVEVEGVVIEVGRRGDDVLFHIWAEGFPADFGDRLHQVVLDTRMEPSRFEAELSGKVGAVWDGTTLSPGPIENVARMAVRANERRLQSWAIKAKGYAPIPGANERLCGEFLSRVILAKE